MQVDEQEYESMGTTHRPGMQQINLPTKKGYTTKFRDLIKFKQYFLG